MTVQELEIERIDRMIRIVSVHRTKKYSPRQRARDKEIVKELQLKLAEFKQNQEKLDPKLALV